MILILITIIAAAAVSIFILIEEFGVLLEFIAFITLIASLFMLVVYPIQAFNYIAAEHKANIINREYGTDYTQSEVFYASDVIETIRRIDRKRIELDTNLLTKNK